MGYHATNLFQHAIPHNAYEHKIAEIIVTKDNCQTLLLPIIATFSQHNSRWLTWITDKVPSKEQLLTYGVNLHALRLIYINHQQDSRWLTWEALAQGNSHAVITELGKLTRQDINAMENAAIQGDTQGIIVRQSNL
jgi:cell division inhibitor SulA